MLDDSRRYYPEGPLASQVLGTVGVDNKGLLGHRAGPRRRSSHGIRRRAARSCKDARGDPVSLEQRRRTSAPGEDLRLTLDASLQARTESVLADVGQTYQPKGATAIVMDPQQRRHPRDGELAAR